MPAVATQITRVTMEEDRVITTDTIKVYAIVVAYNTAGANEATVFFNTADGSRTYFVLTAISGDSEGFHAEWIADEGLSLESGIRGNTASAVVTIIHSAIGI